MKKYHRAVLAGVLIAGFTPAAESIQEGARPSVAESMQKVAEQSGEIKRLSEDVRQEKDPVAREALLRDLRSAFTRYSDEIDAADQKRLEELDAHRAGLVQRMAEARIERQKRIETLIRTLAESDPVATQ